MGRRMKESTMTQYYYRAVDPQGEAATGTMEAPSARHVTQVLQERGLTVNEVGEVNPKPSLLRAAHSLTWEDLHLFNEQLRAIVKGGLPLALSLKHLAADLQGSRLKPVLERLHADLERGESFETAMEKQRGAFPHVFLAMVRAGESTGNLAGVLQLMTDYSSRMVVMKNTLQTALVYPVLVLVASLCVLWFLIAQVVPEFEGIFKEFGGRLPAPTAFWIGMSRHLRAEWSTWCVAVAATLIVLHLARRIIERKESGRAWLDSLKMHLPVVGRTVYLVAMGRFSRTLGMLLASRVPILESLELAASVSGSAQLERAAGEASLSVAGGERIADALSRTRLFSHHFCWLLSASEERGEMEVALESYADACQREVTMRDKMMGLFVVPLLAVVMGLLVGSLVISLYLPIFSLGDMIGMG